METERTTKAPRLFANKRIEAGEGERIGERWAILDGIAFFYKPSINMWVRHEDQTKAMRLIEEVRNPPPPPEPKPAPIKEASATERIEAGEGERVGKFALLGGWAYVSKEIHGRRYWTRANSQNAAMQRIERIRAGLSEFTTSPHQLILSGQGERVGDNLVILDNIVYYYKASNCRWTPIEDQASGWRRVERVRTGSTFSKEEHIRVVKQIQVQRQAVRKDLPYKRSIPLSSLIEKHGEGVQDILAGMDTDGEIVLDESPSGIVIARVQGTPSEQINRGEGEILGHVALLDGHYYRQLASGEWWHYTDQDRGRKVFLDRKNNQPLRALEKANVRLPRHFLAATDVWERCLPTNDCIFCKNNPVDSYCLFCDRYYLDHLLPTVPALPSASQAGSLTKIGHLTPIRRTGDQTFLFRCDCGKKVERVYNNVRHNPDAKCDHCMSPFRTLDENRKKLAEKHYDWAMQQCRALGKRYGLHEDDAESVVNLRFVKLMSRYDGSLDDDNALRSWCYMRLRNAIWTEKSKRRDEEDAIETDYLADIAIDYRSQIRDEGLNDLLHGLSDVFVAVLELHSLHGYDMKHIADKFNMPQSKVSEIYHRAVRYLETRLQVAS